MMVNGMPFHITDNFQSALQDLRDKERSRLLWVDAICINHRDYDERAFQVGRMTAIFQIAAHTIIYLGDIEAETEDFSNLLSPPA